MPPPVVDPAVVQQRLELILLGERKYTRLQVADLAGIEPEAAHKLWLALGFPEVGDDEIVFTDRDVAAMRTAGDLVEDGVIDEALRTSVTRMLGQSMSRVAEWETSRIVAVIAAQADVLRTEDDIGEFISRVLPRIELIQGLVWRRHLAAHAERALGGAGVQADSRPQAVGFIDITGYTSLSRRVSEGELATVLERFESSAAELIARHHARIIKSLGDEVLYVADDLVDAVEVALAMIELAAADDVLPELHAGLAWGPVLSRFGDVYGSTVNLASRLTSIARAGSVLIDLASAAELQADARYSVRRVRPTTVRGFVNLQPSTLRRA